MSDSRATGWQVSERALMARNNRKLARDGLRFKKFRDGTPYTEGLGRYYSVDDHNCITGPAGDDLEAIASDSVS